MGGRTSTWRRTRCRAYPLTRGSSPWRWRGGSSPAGRWRPITGSLRSRCVCVCVYMSVGGVCMGGYLCPAVEVCACCQGCGGMFVNVNVNVNVNANVCQCQCQCQCVRFGVLRCCGGGRGGRADFLGALHTNTDCPIKGQRRTYIKRRESLLFVVAPASWPCAFDTDTPGPHLV